MTSQEHACAGLEMICNAIDMRKTITTPPHAVEHTATIINIVEGNETVINIQFPKQAPERLIINKRCSGNGSALYIYLSARLTGTRYRYIHLKNHYGTGMLFRKFITTKLKEAASKWGSYKDARLWCANELGNFKTQLESSWEHQIKQLVPLPRKRRKSLVDTNTSVRKARRSTTISIPLHGFVMKGEVPVIRIRQAKSKDRLFLLINLPGVIFDDNKSRRKSFKTRFGHKYQWMQFVGKQIKSISNTWETLDDVQTWFLKGNFVNEINQLWEMRGKIKLL